MHGSYVEIIRADGRVDRHSLERGRTTIGRDAEAEIALADAPELEPMHLLVEPREDGCWVSVARTARTPARRAGTTFENGLVAWGTELDVGAVTFRLARAEVRPSRRRRLAGPARKAALLAGCLWVAATVIGGPPEGPPRARVPAPPLFADDAPAECPVALAEARARAREATEAAIARAERYPFSPHDGVEAVGQWAAAAACLAVAGEPGAAAEARAERDRLRARVDDDYRAHRLALERALEHRHHAAALDEARLVADLLRDHDGEYRHWLARLERSLIARVAKEKKRR